MATDEPLAEARERHDHQSIVIAEGCVPAWLRKNSEVRWQDGDEPVTMAPPGKGKRLESAP
jgi:hypothetical protein